ncbi:MAG: hypothetical protein HN366_00330 [Deltaproteobacteria bacterium]|nr:hypothetical protein [Deltaproteobacteria bacterium]
MASNDVKRSFLRIGLKFCGGCNPEFDRGSVANGIAEGLKGKATVVPFEERDLIHNRNITLVRATEKEMVRAAGFLSRKLNKSKGLVRVMIPLKGFCEPNQKGKPFYNPEADGSFIRTLEESLRSDIPIIKVNAHINDVPFVRKGAEQMIRMLS